MKAQMRNLWKIAVLLALVASLFGAGFSQAMAAALPASTACTRTGTASTCNLYAKSGSFTPPGGVLTTFWGYTDTSAGVLSTPGGPVLVVTQGDLVTVNLTNNLPESTSLLFQGQAMIPDTSAGAAALTGTKSYTFTASQPGTFLYEAGLKPGSQHQVAMGLYGALVVRPSSAPLQAYASAATAFNEEALVLLSEIDPALNNSASPATFDMRNYKPQYFLINGKTYPNTDAIPVTAGNTVLLRYVNAGLLAHAMSGLGFSQQIIGQDGRAYLFGHSVVAESIAPGQTLDTLVSISASAPAGTKYPLYDANMLLRNSASAGMGGMMTFITVGSSGTGGDTVGPLVSGLALSPNPTNGSVAVSISASISDASTGNANVSAAEFYIDSTAGTPTAMSGGFGTPTVSVSASISTATLAALSSGNHTIYVRGQDSLGNWGSFASAVLNLDKTGPTTSGLVLSPNPNNGTVSVNLTGSASDAASGNNNVTAAEYWVDAGPHLAMTVGPAAPVNSLSATIPAGLAPGTHVVSVRSRDVLGNWGAPVTINLVIDVTAPATGGLSASPNPNNGSTPYNTSTPAVRVFGSFSDTGGATIAAAEGFLDATAATGTGFVFIATDGNFNSVSESGYGDIPLAVVGALTEGNHTIYVHARDSAGNWNTTFATLTLVIDKTPPTFTSFTATPNPTNGSATITLAFSGAAGSPTGGEYWFGTTAPAAGSGTAFTGLTPSINISAMATGSYSLNVRLRDAANNWSTIKTITLVVVPDAIFSDGFEAAGFPAPWTGSSTNSTSRLNRTATAALVGAFGMQAQGNNGNYVQFTFGTGTNPATATFDARFYFNPHGNTASAQTIFATSTTTNFNANLFLVRYRWNGGAPQVQIQVGNTANATWVGITNASHRIEVVWNSGVSLQLYVDGVLSQTINTAATGSVIAFRLGSVTSGGSSILEYFDAFSAKRTISPLIGP